MNDRSFARRESSAHKRVEFANYPVQDAFTERKKPQPAIPAVPAESEAEKLKAELFAAKEAQESLARRLAALETYNANVVDSRANQTDELAILRSSLAALASELQDEKKRAAAAEAKRTAEEDKVNLLRVKMEESRRALMMLQTQQTRRTSASAESPALHGANQSRRASLNHFTSMPDNTPRRRSSLGLSAASPAVGPLNRSQRGSSSGPGQDDDDRQARLRDLRLGLSSYGFQSGAAGGADGDSRRGSGMPLSILEESDPEFPSRPPSAPLRAQGRNMSVAVFEDFPRRRSSVGFSTSDLRTPPMTFPETPMMGKLGGFGAGAAQSDLDAFRSELQGLRIQLLASEEGRRASEHCLKALKELIAVGGLASGLQLPPLPTDDDDNQADGAARVGKRGSISTLASSRWGLPRLGSLSRRDSIGGLPTVTASTEASPELPSPNLTTWNRRSISGASNGSGATLFDRTRTPSRASSPARPAFGAFSFQTSAYAGDLQNGEASPTMTHSPTSGSSSHEDSGSESEAESDHTTAPSLTSGSSNASSRSTSPTEETFSCHAPLFNVSLSDKTKNEQMAEKAVYTDPSTPKAANLWAH